MPAYNVVNPAAMVNGQPEDISVVKSNFDAIAAVVNALDDTNVAPSAGIQLSKVGASGAASGQVPTWSGSAWVPQTPTAPPSLPSGSNGQIMARVGGAWVAVTPATLSQTKGSVATNQAGVRTMMGYAAYITPVFSGRLAIAFSGSQPSSNAGSSLSYLIRYGTGTAPGNDVPEAGTALGTAIGGGIDSYGGPAHYGNGTINITKVLTGLTVGTQYWFDLANQGSTLSAMNIDIYEF